ncbi:MAG: helix-turn-helix domain-containing protein, partial [Acidimicrobiaceae bacterium]|nr:helix-turn-helix domain-containing protein [Acidimicrobiaceae bacterium]
AGWPDGLPSRNSLDVQLGRLRRRLKGSGLTLRTVRSRGCVLAQGN